MKLKYIIIISALIFMSAKIIGVESETTTASNEILNSQVLIIDAGHGGLDGGAVGNSGICEEDITLNISKQAELISEFLGINCILTRNDQDSLDFDENVSIRENKVSDTRARVSLVNSKENAFLISVHLNKFTDEKYKGAQVFYKDNDVSTNFANILQSEIKVLDSTNNREALIAQDSIYLIKNSNFPSVIYECGFLSNYEEEQRLAQSEYQTKLALCMISSYLKLPKDVNYETKDVVSML